MRRELFLKPRHFQPSSSPIITIAEKETETYSQILSITQLLIKERKLECRSLEAKVGGGYGLNVCVPKFIC